MSINLTRAPLQQACRLVVPVTRRWGARAVEATTRVSHVPGRSDPRVTRAWANLARSPPNDSVRGASEAFHMFARLFEGLLLVSYF
jgi:hypothetical protein